MTEEIQQLLAKRYGGTIPCERLRAQRVVREIVDIMHPKFTPEASAAGETDDGEGYIEDHEWDADTTEAISTALNRAGFGPDSAVKYELVLMLDSLGDEEDGDEDEDDGPDEDEVSDLTDHEWGALEAWAESARDYSRDFPENTQTTDYWNTVIGGIKLRSLGLDHVGNLLEWCEGFTQVEADDNEDDGPHTVLAKKLEQQIQARVERLFVTER